MNFECKYSTLSTEDIEQGRDGEKTRMAIFYRFPRNECSKLTLAFLPPISEAEAGDGTTRFAPTISASCVLEGLPCSAMGKRKSKEAERVP
jgi:hypothetical protein